MSHSRSALANADIGQFLARPEPAGSPAGINAPPSSYYLEAWINGHSSQLLIDCQFHDQTWWILASHLRALGLRIDDLHADPNGWIGLNTVSGLSFRYDGANQRLHLTVLGSRNAQHVFEHTVGTRVGDHAVGGLVSYDAVVERRLGMTSLRAFSEQRIFGEPGVFRNSGIYSSAAGENAYVRLDTSWTRADPESMRSFTAGDFITGSLAWNRSARLAGLQIRRNFGLRPDLVTFPIAEFAGEAAVPSTVDIYVNQVRQFSRDVPAGPFLIRTPPALNGSGQAQVVVRDVLGRESMQTLDLYVVPQLLAKGLSDYSFEAGALRLNYGAQGFDYRPGLAASATLRRGMSDGLTLESHAEAAEDYYQMGAGALFRLGRYGQLNAWLTRSQAGRSGGQFALAYQFVSPAFSVAASLQKANADYRDLPSLTGDLPARRIARLFIGAQLAPRVHLSANYLQNDTPSAAPDAMAGTTTDVPLARTRLVSIAYRHTLTNRVSVSASAFRDFERHGSDGIYVAVSVAMGRAMQLQADYNDADQRVGVALSRRGPYETGLDWQLRGVQNGGTSVYGGANYAGNVGEIRADFASEHGIDRWQLGGRGAVVLMGETVMAGRYVQDEFALVSTDGIPGVPVLHENRPAGRTNHGGYLLLPSLNAYQLNHVAIDPLAVPFNYRVGEERQSAVPRLSAGTLVRFAIDDPDSLTLRLVNAAGEPLAAGSRGKVVGSNAEFVVGYEGIAYLTDAGDSLALRVATASRTCSARVSRKSDDSARAEPGTVVCR